MDEKKRNRVFFFSLLSFLPALVGDDGRRGAVVEEQVFVVLLIFRHKMLTCRMRVSARVSPGHTNEEKSNNKHTAMLPRVLAHMTVFMRSSAVRLIRDMRVSVATASSMDCNENPVSENNESKEAGGVGLPA